MAKANRNSLNSLMTELRNVISEVIGEDEKILLEEKYSPKSTYYYLTYRFFMSNDKFCITIVYRINDNCDIENLTVTIKFWSFLYKNFCFTKNKIEKKELINFDLKIYILKEIINIYD